MRLFSTIKNELNQKQVFWILLSVIIAVVPHFPRLPIWFPLFLIFTVTYRWLNGLKKLKPMPPWIVMFLTLMSFTGLIYFYGVSLNRELSVTVLTLMTVMKLLETWRKRDAWMVVTLCYFVILTRFFYSQDMLLILYLIAALVIITHALFVLQHSEKQGILRKSEMRQTVSLLIAAVPLAILFFVFFPRLGSPIWGSPDLFGQGKTGISEEMSPGSISELFQDDSTAFRVTFDNNVRPPNQQLYWRGPVLWDFDGMTWTRNKDLKPIQRSNEFLDLGQRINYEVELEPTGQKYVFALDYTYKTSSKYFLLADSQTKSPLDVNQLTHYRASSVLMAYNPFEYLSPKSLRRLTALPRGFNPKTRAIIDEWLKEDLSAEELIEKALTWFATDPFFYTFTPPPLSGNTVDQFLFETRSGFCEHYASAFTFMMRAAGLPARIVTGYQGGINNGKYLLVKQSDAHAWSEVWIQGKGWLRVDPTAAVSPLRVEQGTQALISRNARNWYDTSWSRRLGERYDALRHNWNQWIRDFNAEKQRAMFESLGFDSRDGKGVAMVLGAIILLTTLFVLLYLYIIRPKKKLTTLDKTYHQFLQILAKKGLNKDSSTGLMEFSEQAQTEFKSSKDLIAEFSNLYIKVRYSKAKVNTDIVQSRLKKILNQLKESLV